MSSGNTLLGLAPSDGEVGTMVLTDTIRDCDAGLCGLLGLPPEQLIGHEPREFSEHQQEGGAASRVWQQRMSAAAGGLAQSFLWRFRRADGTPLLALVQARRAVADPQQLTVQVRDLDPLRHARRALQESEARLQQVVDNTTANIFVKDREGRYVLVNREFTRLAGRPAREIVGRSDRELFPPELAARFRHNDLRVLMEGRAIEFEESGVFAGETRTFLSSKFPLLDAAGMPYAVCGIATDITERKRIEDALSSAALAVSSAEGEPLFAELARYLATILDVECAFVSRLEPQDPAKLRVIALWLDGTTREHFEYGLSGTACEQVLGQAFRVYPSGLGEHFPAARSFLGMTPESYAGYPLNDSAGRPLGVIAVMSRRPLGRPQFVEAVLKIFAVRASAELERQRAEQHLRASEASYREIFEASEDAIFVHDWDSGAIVDVNPKACTTYGYTHEEMLRVSVDDLGSGVPPYTGADAARLIEQAKRNGSTRTEWHRRNKDGSLHWDEVFLKSARIGGVPRILAFTRDITARRQYEENLRRSEDRLRATVQAALDCIVVMDARGLVIEMNPAAQGCFGYTREQAIGRPLADLMIPERFREAHSRGMEHYLATGEGPFLGKRVEIRAVRADGTEFPIELAIGVAEGPEGRIFIGYLRDITERKEAEERRARLEAQLRQAQKMEAIGQLTGGIAHDFNNLLTSIMGYVVLATEREAARSDQRLANYLAQAHLSCERARDLIQKMLMFSRGQRGAPRPLALPPVIEQALGLVRPSLPAGVDVRLELDRDAPAARLDPVQLEQVLLNLCINARDALDGAGTITIAVREASVSGGVCTSCRKGVSGAFVELCVTDDGPGIAPEVLERIFEPFFSTKELGKGTGMGLATVHGIVHEHGGHVMVHTAPGAGARFSVLFPPLLRNEAVTAAAPAIGGRPLGAAPQLRGEVLVVDDEEAVGEFMRELLETWGLQATFLARPQEALEVVAQSPARFDLVITDQAMPKMSGVELAQSLRTVRADLPIILYTGFGEGISPARLEAGGIRTVLRKPIDPPELARALREHLAPAGGKLDTRTSPA